jgi:nitroreductase
MDLYQVLEERRSIRKFLPDPVSEQSLTKILDAARIAPSWKNLQCWRFIVVREPAKREQLAATLVSGNPAAKAVANAPVVIVVCGDPEASGNQDGKLYYLLDAGLALQQLMLAAHAEGLGTCWVAWFDEARAREICKVPPQYRVVALTPLGIPEGQPSPRPRKALDEITFTEEWGQPFSLGD